MKQIYTYLILFLCITYSGYTQITAGFSLKSIRIGEQVQLTFKNLPDGDILWPSIKDTLTEKVEVIDSVIEKKDGKIINKTYTITSFDSGYYALKPLLFFINGAPVETNALLLEVHTVEVDTTKEIKDIKTIKKINYNGGINNQSESGLSKYWYIFVAIVVAVGLIFIWWYYKGKHKKNSEENKIELPLHIQLINSLNEIKEKQILQKTGVKPYYTAITDLLRDYLEKRYGVDALEQTSYQLLNNLKTSGISAEAFEILRSILQTADMVKFAKANPDVYECEAVLDNAKRFAQITAVITSNKENNDVV